MDENKISWHFKKSLNLPSKIKGKRDNEHNFCELIKLRKADYEVASSDDMTWI